MRADTTLIGFDQNDWQRGNRSYVFKGGGKTVLFIYLFIYLLIYLLTVYITANYIGSSSD